MSKRPFQSLCATTLCLSIISAYVPVPAFAGIIADHTANNNRHPAISKNQQGTVIVQIATPNNKGVSYNQYREFDVGKKGAVLSNSKTAQPVQYLPVGTIAANPNLANTGPAKLIINEVTGTKPSTLAGTLAVHGTKADVVISNPNGITMNGFTLANADRGVLTTGKPVLDASGRLDSYRVTKGSIGIEGKGVNFLNIKRADLIARGININGKIWSDMGELSMVTGSNNVRHDGIYPVKILQGEDAQPTFAIDLGTQGGMYANKIHLIGTEKGIGVHTGDSDTPIILKPNGFDLSLSGHLKIRDIHQHTDMPTFGNSDNDIPDIPSPAVKTLTALPYDKNNKQNTLLTKLPANKSQGIRVLMKKDGAIGLEPSTTKPLDTGLTDGDGDAGTVLGIIALAVGLPLAISTMLFKPTTSAATPSTTTDTSPQDNLAVASTSSMPDTPNYWTAQAEQHTFYGDRRGGGHLYGTPSNGKDKFPATWDKNRIKSVVNTVIANAETVWVQRGSYQYTHGTSDNIKFKIIFDPATSTVVTAYPLGPSSVPANTARPTTSYYAGQPVYRAPTPSYYQGNPLYASSSAYPDVVSNDLNPMASNASHAAIDNALPIIPLQAQNNAIPDNTISIALPPGNLDINSIDPAQLGDIDNHLYPMP